MSALQELRRSTADRKVTGLCGGVARSWGIDPLLVRILAVLLALSGGLGLVLYAFGWLLVPEDGSSEPAAHRLLPASRGWSREVWTILLVVGGILSVSVLGQLVPFGLMPAVVVAAVWYFGFRKSGSSSTTSATLPPAHDPLAGPPTPFTEAARAWQTRMAEQQTPSPIQPTQSTQQYRPFAYVHQPSPEPAGPAQPLAPNASAPSAPPPDYYAHPDPAGLYATADLPTAPGGPAGATAVATRRPSVLPAARRLRLGVLITLGLVLSGLGLADVLGAPVSVVTYLATSLLVVGIGLVAAGWFGRARGLLPVGVLLLVCTGLAQAAAIGWQVYGEDLSRPHRYSYSTIAEVPSAQTFDVGRYSVDLTRVTVDADRSYQLKVGLGDVRVELPAGQRVRVEAATNAGVITLPGISRNGSDLVVSEWYGPTDPDLPVLTVRVQVDAGNITVTR